MDEKKRSPLRNLILITEVGLAVIVPTILGLFLGRFLDRKFSTNCWLLILLFLGLAAGLTGAWRLLKAFAPKKEDDAKPEKYDLMEEWKSGRSEDDRPKDL